MEIQINKMKKIKQFIVSHWTTLVEIGVVIWAVNGIMSEYVSGGYVFSPREYHTSPVWAYFLSAVLILYLTRRYKKKN